MLKVYNKKFQCPASNVIDPHLTWTCPNQICDWNSMWKSHHLWSSLKGVITLRYCIFFSAHCISMQIIFGSSEQRRMLLTLNALYFVLYWTSKVYQMELHLSSWWVQELLFLTPPEMLAFQNPYWYSFVSLSGFWVGRSFYRLQDRGYLHLDRAIWRYEDYIIGELIILHKRRVKGSWKVNFSGGVNVHCSNHQGM